MKPIIALIALPAALAASPLLAAEPITGNWVTPEKDAVVTIGKCGSAYCGRLSKYLVTPEGGADQKDVNNPEPKLRQRKLLGIALLSGFVEEAKSWRGKIYDPRNGRTYRSFLSRKSANVLEVKGCWGPFCQTQTWTRAR